jgi:hypothetical protein
MVDAEGELSPGIALVGSVAGVLEFVLDLARTWVETAWIAKKKIQERVRFRDEPWQECFAEMGPGFSFLCVKTTTASSQATCPGSRRRKVIGGRFVTIHSKTSVGLCENGFEEVNFKKFHGQGRNLAFSDGMPELRQNE